MKNSFKLYTLLFLMGFIVTRLNAGGFDADISDWAHDGVSAEDFPLIKQYNLKDYVQAYVQAAAKEKGIKAPVIVDSVELSLFYSEEGRYDCSTDDNVERRKESISKGLPPIVHKLCLGVQLFRLHGSLAVIHHELGHAKSAESCPEKWLAMEKEDGYVCDLGSKSSRISQWFQGFQKRKKELYNYVYQQEQYADAAIPDDKKLLKAERNALVLHHAACSFMRTALSADSESELLTAGKLAYYKKLFHGTEILDFSKAFDESKAQDWDKWMHESIFEDYHPSDYRRAHYFNDRLKGIEAKELTQSIAKGNLLDQFSQELTTGDMLS